MREQNGVWINGENVSEYLRYRPSNADMIRAMTDEELAVYLSRLSNPTTLYPELFFKIWLDWLKEESKE